MGTELLVCFLITPQAGEDSACHSTLEAPGLTQPGIICFQNNSRLPSPSVNITLFSCFLLHTSFCSYFTTKQKELISNYRTHPIILGPFQYAQVPSKCLHLTLQRWEHSSAACSPDPLWLHCKGRKSQSWKPRPPVNRDRFSLIKWFLGKAALGAMETRQLSC